ncbi:MAG: UDP-N-acetylglucosamine 2-epimerase (non-hydrolyzing) [bacterium]
MKKVLVVFGTRPEAIKMAPVIRKLKQHNNEISTRVCVTAQHRALLDQVLQFFKIGPEKDLDVMKPGQDLFDITSNVLLGMKNVLRDEKPDIVLVQGDTTTSFITALASFYEGIPVAHVEAGLRTNNLRAPFPEEANRQIISRVAQIHLAPTQFNKQSLLGEGVPEKNIFVTGNTIVDAIQWTLEIIKSRPVDYYHSFLNGASRVLKEEKPLILVTGHRRESFGPGFERICTALKRIAERNPGVNLIYPVHPNPNVKKPVFEILGNLKNFYLIDPLEYDPFVYLMDQSAILLTDSGGIQEEAPTLKKPLLVMREVTERMEAVNAGIATLVGTDEEKIVFETERLLNDASHYRKVANVENPFGDGKASERIYNILKDFK